MAPIPDTTAPVAPPTEHPLLLGRYRVVELRDQGGFGSVLVCWDIRLQRRVAVKCLPLDEGGTAFEEGLAEARASSFLTHPNIVTVHDFAQDDSYAYLVMEYVDGVTLSELMARVEGGVLIWCEVAHVLESVASALSYAHDNGVLHLDIKPANVMIAKDGTVKLGDFGMASLASAAGWGGARGGTVGYMPPEQLSGDLVDERTDVFSLAAVCYEALTGCAPFAAKTPAASLKLIEKGATPLGDVEEGLAGPVDLAFRQALSPTPAGRMVDAAEFAGEVLPSLGDPEEGRDSIVELLAAPEMGTEEFDEGAWRALDPPGRRVLGLAEACRRGAGAALALAAAWLCAAPLGITAPLPVVALLAGAAVLGAVAPLGAVGGATILLALAAGASGVAAGLPAQGVLAAALVAVPGLAWCVRFSWDGDLPAVLLAAPVTGSAGATAAAASYFFGPAAAAAASAAGALMACALGGGSLWANPTEALAALPAQLASPGTWALVALAAAAGAAGSALSRRGQSTWAAAGQVVAFILVMIGFSLRAGLEFGGIWGTPPTAPALLAVGSTVLMIVVVTLFGPPELRREGEDRELS